MVSQNAVNQSTDTAAHTQTDRIHQDATPRKNQTAWLAQLGCVPYTQAWTWQRSLVADRKADPGLPDVLLLLEHPPVYTLGRGASLAFVGANLAGADRGGAGLGKEESPAIHRTERGGEVTYHCPGQIVGYPILNLQRHRPDLHWYLRELEQVLIEVLAHYGLRGDRLPGLTGVWVEGYKVAAIGVHASRWITMHGFALNVCPDLGGFGAIVPCGIRDRPVGSLEQFCPGLTPQDVEAQIAICFSDRFGLSWEPLSASDLPPELSALPVPLSKKQHTP